MKLKSVLLGVVLVLSLVGCSSKTISLDDYAKFKGIVCVDETSGYSHIEGMLEVKSVKTDIGYIEVWSFDNDTNAKTWLSNYKDTLMNNSDEVLNDIYVISDEYYKIIQDGKTCIFIRGNSKEGVVSMVTELGIK